MGSGFKKRRIKNRGMGERGSREPGRMRCRKRKHRKKTRDETETERQRKSKSKTERAEIGKMKERERG